MYEYLTGVVTFINPYYIVVEANGIGYQIALGNPYRYSSQMNKEVKSTSIKSSEKMRIFSMASVL